MDTASRRRSSAVRSVVGAAVIGAVALAIVSIGGALHGRSHAEAAATPITEVYVSSTDGLIRKVIVSGPTKGTATIVGKTPNDCADSLLFDPSGKLIVTGLCSANLYRIDPQLPGGASNLGTLLNTSSLTSGAADPALNAAGTKVFVSSFSSAVDEVELATGTVTLHSLTGMTMSSGVAFDSAGHLWATDYSAGSVGIVDLLSNTYTPLCTGLPQSDGLAFDRSSGKLYVSGQSTNKIRQLTITASSCSVSGTWDVTNDPDGIAPDGVGGVFAAGQNGTLIRLDTTDGSIDSIVSGIASLDDIAPVIGFGAPVGQPTVVPPKSAPTPCIGGIVNSRCPGNPPDVKVTATPAATATSAPPTQAPPTAIPPQSTATQPGGGAAGVITGPNTGSGPGNAQLRLGWLLLAVAMLSGGAVLSTAALRTRRR